MPAFLLLLFLPTSPAAGPAPLQATFRRHTVPSTAALPRISSSPRQRTVRRLFSLILTHHSSPSPAISLLSLPPPRPSYNSLTETSTLQHLHWRRARYRLRETSTENHLLLAQPAMQEWAMGRSWHSVVPVHLWLDSESAEVSIPRAVLGTMRVLSASRPLLLGTTPQNMSQMASKCLRVSLNCTMGCANLLMIMYRLS